MTFARVTFACRLGVYPKATKVRSCRIGWKLKIFYSHRVNRPRALLTSLSVSVVHSRALEVPFFSSFGTWRGLVSLHRGFDGLPERSRWLPEASTVRFGEDQSGSERQLEVVPPHVRMAAQDWEPI